MAVKVARSNDCAAAASPKATRSCEGSAPTPIVMASSPFVPSIVSVPLSTDADGDGGESAKADWIGSAPRAPTASVADAAMPTGPMLSFERMVMTSPLSGRDRRGGGHPTERGSPDGSSTPSRQCEVGHDQECRDAVIVTFRSSSDAYGDRRLDLGRA